MSQGSEAAELIVKESIQITGEAAKLAALGAKNLAALLVALYKDNPKLAGKTNLNRMLREGRELKVFDVKSTDLTQFVIEAKRYGVLFTVIKDEADPLGSVDVVVRAEDASKINRILQRMGYAAPTQEEEPPEKKAHPRARFEPNFDGRGTGRTPQPQPTEAATDTQEKPSVKEKIKQNQGQIDRIAAMRQAQERMDKGGATPSRPRLRPMSDHTK